MTLLEVGKLLRAGSGGFVAGCAASQFEIPTFGGLVRAQLSPEYQVYGLISDIRIEDDGLVRQLVTAENVSPEVLRDNRERRIVPVEITALTIGYAQNGQIFHLLPPRPPLSLDSLYACDEAETWRFVSAGRRLGYLRHILRAQEAPIGELLAAHLQQAGKNQPAWRQAAVREIITLLRDDYPLLMGVLGALGEVERADQA